MYSTFLIGAVIASDLSNPVRLPDRLLSTKWEDPIELRQRTSDATCQYLYPGKEVESTGSYPYQTSDEETLIYIKCRLKRPSSVNVSERSQKKWLETAGPWALLCGGSSSWTGTRMVKPDSWGVPNSKAQCKRRKHKKVKNGKVNETSGQADPKAPSQESSACCR